MAPVAGLAPARTRLKGEVLGSLHSRALMEMAERGGHAPHPPEADDLFSKESRLACPVHVPWCPRRELHSHWPRFEVGASAVGLRGRKEKCSRSDSHRH